jgi:hypothetical protein
VTFNFKTKTGDCNPSSSVGSEASPTGRTVFLRRWFALSIPLVCAPDHLYFRYNNLNGRHSQVRPLRLAPPGLTTEALFSRNRIIRCTRAFVCQLVLRFIIVGLLVLTRDWRLRVCLLGKTLTI